VTTGLGQKGSKQSALPTLPFPVQSQHSAVCASSCVRTVAQWKVRNEGCKTTKKQVGSGTETEMWRNEVMALVFCLVGSCPACAAAVLSPASAANEPRHLYQSKLNPGEIFRFLPYFSLVLRNLRFPHLFCCGCSRCPGIRRCCPLSVSRWGTPTERRGRHIPGDLSNCPQLLVSAGVWPAYSGDVCICTPWSRMGSGIQLHAFLPHF